jgi:hypothetical protein
MFGCETTAVQSTYNLLIFMQKNTILADFLPCFLLFLPFLGFRKYFKQNFHLVT